MWIVASLVRVGLECIYLICATHPPVHAQYRPHPTDATGCQASHTTKGPWTLQTTCPDHRHVCAAEEDAAAPFR